MRMDRDLSDQYRADPTTFGGDGVVPEVIVFEEEEAEDYGEESLMDALSQYITFDLEGESVSGCENDFRHTRAILAEHGQEESAEEVIALLNKQGAYCDCEVLLNSRIDIVFIDDDDEELEQED